MAKELYGLKILVVDDDKDTLELLEWVLEARGGGGDRRLVGARRPWTRSSASGPTSWSATSPCRRRTASASCGASARCPRRAAGRIAGGRPHRALDGPGPAAVPARRLPEPRPQAGGARRAGRGGDQHRAPARARRLGPTRVERARTRPLRRTFRSRAREPRQTASVTARRTRPSAGPTGARNVGANRHRSPLRPSARGRRRRSDPPRRACGAVP